MLNSGKKICALRDKIINILTLVLSEKQILNETKNHKWSVPYAKLMNNYVVFDATNINSEFNIISMLFFLIYVHYAKL